MKQGGLEHLRNATLNSLRGLRAVWKDETAFRQECIVLAGIALAASAVPGLTAWDRILLVGSWLLVLSAELLNTALECAFDLVTEEFHPLVKKGKDAASAAIFVMICLNVLLWAGYCVSF